MTDKQKTLNLALQGGGSHSAFTWGVLDRLLEEDALRIEGISGTSGGAMNAAMLIQGYAKNGASGAQRALDLFWESVAALSPGAMMSPVVADPLSSSWETDMAGTAPIMMETMQRLLSPYQVNPLNINPLRDLLIEILDLEAIRSAAIKLFIAATNVETGRVRIFSGNEISVDTLMASACLPFTFQAVEIDGVPYWDGGYTGNPALFPLRQQCHSPDIIIVRINPMFRPGTPETPTEMVHRLNEISFNAPLIGEIGSLARHQSDADAINLHVIAAEEEMRALGASSKMNTDWEFLLHIKDIGRRAAESWLQRNWDNIGKKSTLDFDCYS